MQKNSTNKKKYNPVALIILDGWGIREREHGNSTKHAKLPNFTNWLQNYERCVLDASEEAVGLPEGQMGNSEVGHLNLGSGRVVFEAITKINSAIKNDTLKQNDVISTTFEKLEETKGKLHLIGLVSDGGVHSELDHLFALIDIANSKNVNVVIHVITDGRDTDSKSGVNYVRQLQDKLDQTQNGVIASISGRYYTMDRDNRWDRTKKGYDVIFSSESITSLMDSSFVKTFETAEEALLSSYNDGVTDEFVVPRLINTTKDKTVAENDIVFFYNFRADRMRQIVSSLYFKDFTNFETAVNLKKEQIVTMTEYDDDFVDLAVAFPFEDLKNPLAEVISEAGLTQLHSAETEKYAHVTYFFNGKREIPFENEDRILVDSPKVATYDLQPEMSAYEVIDKVEKAIKEKHYDFVLVNFANPDMVGHTGVLEAAVKAIEVVDECAARLVKAINDQGGIALVTADHGNCEIMINEKTGEPHTYHTTQPVHFFAIGPDNLWLKPRGKLADVAPTVLDLLGLEKPSEMTGSSLIDW